MGEGLGETESSEACVARVRTPQPPIGFAGIWTRRRVRRRMRHHIGWQNRSGRVGPDVYGRFAAPRGRCPKPRVKAPLRKIKTILYDIQCD